MGKGARAITGWMALCGASWLFAVLAPAATAARVPPQGVFEQCAPTPALADCSARLAMAGRAGMRIVLNYNAFAAHPRALDAYARAAARHRVKLIWSLVHPAFRGHMPIAQAFPALAEGCRCSDLLAFIVRRLRDEPATWGWYVGDELPASEADATHALAERVRQLDPRHPRLYVQAGLDGLFGPGLAPFAPSAHYLGNAMFTIGTPFAMDLVTQTMRHASREARAHRRRFVAVLQAFAWKQVRNAPVVPRPDLFPSRRHFVAQRNRAIRASRPSFILWYSLHDVLASAHPARNWAALVSAARAPAPRG